MNKIVKTAGISQMIWGVAGFSAIVYSAYLYFLNGDKIDVIYFAVLAVFMVLNSLFVQINDETL